MRVWSIRNGLFALPEIKAFLAENKLYYSAGRGSSVDRLMRPLQNEFTGSKITLRDLLNKITRIKGGGWILKQNKRFDDKEKEFIEIEV